MTITARYPSQCSACGGAIGAGERIEWSKGMPARHSQCGTPVAATSPTTSSATGRCAKCGGACKPGYRTCYRCSSAAKTCRACGHIEKRDSRGYPVGDRVSGGECQSCREERQMGY
jgi:hypothetical protein